MKVKPFNKPETQFTQLHNSIFDVVMRQCKPSEWQVLCAIIRKTRGWDKPGDKISYTQIMELTGIASKSTISRAVQGLIKKNMIVTSGTYGATTYYQLNKDYTIEQTSTKTVLVDEAESDQYKNCTGTGTENGLPTSTDSVHTKELNSLNKERNINKESTALHSRLIQKHSLILSPTEKKIVTLLKRCRPAPGDENTLILQAPDQDTCDWLDSRCRAILERDLTGIVGKRMSVKLESLEVINV